MKILITGGTGFLGRHCALRLNAANHEVTVLGRNALIGAELEKRGIRFIKANLIDESAVRLACFGQDKVVHAGALNSRWGKYSEFYQSNVIGTKNVIDACLKQGVERLIHLSTPSLYFNYQDRLGIKESEPLPKPRTAYARTKGIADSLIEQSSVQGLSSIILRPRAIFGFGDQNVIGRILTAAQNGTIYLPNGGQSYIDLTYLDNAVDALLLALNAPKEALGKTFNITNGEPITFYKLVEMLSKSLNLDLTIRCIPFPLAYAMASAMEVCYGVMRREPPLTREIIGFMSRSLTLDISAAQDSLSYAPRINLSEGFELYADWWKKCKSEKSSFAERIGFYS